MRKSLFVTIYFLLFVAVEIAAQQWLAEYIEVHLSKNIAVVGEVIHAKVVVSSEGVQVPSKIIYVELVDRAGQPVQQLMFPLEAGRANIAVPVPNSLDTDNYLLRCYTRVSPLISGNGVSNHYVSVFNPSKPPISNTKVDTTTLVQSRPITNSQFAKSVSTNTEFPLFLNDFNDAKEMSISVALANPFAPSGKISDEIYKPFPNNIHKIPELYGHIVHAKQVDKVQDTTETFFLSAHGKQSYLVTAKPTIEGDLFFELGALKDYKYFIVQSSKFEKQLNFQLQLPFHIFEFKDNFQIPPLVVSQDWKQLIESVTLSGKVSTYFYAELQQGLPSIVTGYQPDASYLLDDYTRFENLATTLKEYVPQVYVRGQGKKTLFKVINAPRNQAFEENPLILIDAMPVFDTDALGVFDASKIKRLDLITREYSFGADKYFGLISLTSYNNDFGGFALPPNALYLNYPIIQEERKFKSPHINDRLNDRYNPDFRTLLFWEPSAGSLPENIFSSSVAGEYVLTVGIVGENGRMKFYNESLIVIDPAN